MKMLQTILHDEYDNYLIEQGAIDDKKRKYDYFHPSEFGSCLRKVALKSHGISSGVVIEPRVRRIFQAGHDYHGGMQKRFAEMGIIRGLWECKRCKKVHGKENKWGIFMPEDCECTAKLPPDFPNADRKGLDLFTYEELRLENEEYNFKGHCDAIIELVKGDPSERYVVDFKTVNGDKFQFLKRPDSQYVVQINIYMWILGIKQGIIFYEDKNRHEIKEFLVKYDQGIIDDVLKNAVKLRKIIENNQIPKINKNYKKTTKPCAYCDFKSYCWK